MFRDIGIYCGFTRIRIFSIPDPRVKKSTRSGSRSGFRIRIRIHWPLLTGSETLVRYWLHLECVVCVLRFFNTLCYRSKCTGSEEAVQNRLESIAEQWELLTQKTSEKSMKLKEANRQRTFIAAVKDLDFWLGEVEALLTTDELGQSIFLIRPLS